MNAQQPLLSLCIPTFNRAERLERCIDFHRDAFRHLGIDIEIVIVDDHSTDATADYVASLAGMPEISAYRREQNGGFLDSFSFAMRRARGRYATFLGDDDFLVPEQVRDYLARLEGDPQIGMIQAPWHCIDERGGGMSMGRFYEIPAETRFTRADFAGLLDFVLGFQVFPEFMIVRREVLQRAVSAATPFMFWAFSLTARALAQADILFVPEPFARVTTIAADAKAQQGRKDTMFQWDLYRGGVEYLVSLAQQGDAVPASPQQRAHVGERVQNFVLRRQQTAFKLHVFSKNWPEAYSLYHRIAANGAAPITPPQFEQMRRMAGLAAAASDAAGFRAATVIVDPSIGDDILGELKQDLRSRLGRPMPNNSVAVAPSAYLRLDPRFPQMPRPEDAVFDVSDYIAQFV